MSDIVKRLRDYDRTTAAKDMVEAADRIEALEAALRRMEAEARRYAGIYPQSSDGQNTFLMFADWVVAALAPQQSSPPKATQ
jgi:hypothetical protein